MVTIQIDEKRAQNPIYEPIVDFVKRYAANATSVSNFWARIDFWTICEQTLDDNRCLICDNCGNRLMVDDLLKSVTEVSL